MTKYKEVKGTTIRILSADPPAPIEGEIWFNSTSGTLKGYKEGVYTWATGSDLNSSRSILGSAGTQTAALAFGGSPSGGATESYNGTSWTELNDLNIQRFGLAGAGSQTSALAFGSWALSFTSPNGGGYIYTESWNGTSWTEVNELNTDRREAGGAGADNTSALAFGGIPSSALTTTNTESWNGTSWTEVNDLGTGRYGLAAAGTQTAALGFGGHDGTSQVAVTESWNGTSWTEVNDLNTGRNGIAGDGTQTSALGFGGKVAAVTGATEEWNGTNWTETSDLNTARFYLGGAGASNTSAVAFGGSGTETSAATEEFNFGPVTVSFDEVV